MRRVWRESNTAVLNREELNRNQYFKNYDMPFLNVIFLKFKQIKIRCCITKLFVLKMTLFIVMPYDILATL